MKAAIIMYEGSIQKSSQRKMLETKFRSARGGPLHLQSQTLVCEDKLGSKDQIFNIGF